MKTLLALLLLLPNLTWGNESFDDYFNETYNLAKEINTKDLKYKQLEKSCNRIEFLLKEKKIYVTILKMDDSEIKDEYLNKYKEYLRGFISSNPSEDYCGEVRRQNILNDILMNNNFEYYEKCLDNQDKVDDSTFLRSLKKINRYRMFCSDVIYNTRLIKDKIEQENDKIRKVNNTIDEKRKRFSNDCFRKNLKDGLSDMAVNMLMNTCVEDAAAKYPHKPYK